MPVPTKYSLEEKLKAVQDYLSNKKSYEKDLKSIFIAFHILIINIYITLNNLFISNVFSIT